MHADVGLGGFVYWFVLILFGGTAFLALYTAVDGLRRSSTDFGTNASSRFAFVGISLAYLIVFGLGTLSAWPGDALVVTTATPISLVTSVIYLLRVVFPSPERLTARAQREEESIDSAEPASVDGASAPDQPEETPHA